MGTVVFDINTDNIKAFTQRLQEMNRYAFPVAIRQTLSKAAFDVKINTMPRFAGKIFEHRQQNFFKANSKVDPAKGLDIKSMVATVGFVSSGLHNQSTNYAVEDLTQQEYGGKIGSKSFIPMRSARISNQGMVKSAYRMEKLGDKKFINAKNVRSLSGHSAAILLAKVRKQKLIRAAIIANRLDSSNAYVLGNPNSAGVQTLFKVQSLRLGEKFSMKLIPIYDVSSDRRIKVSRTNFMRMSSLESQKIMAEVYSKEAFKQISKHLNK